jgi:diaminohydroxyphosphoribosylaminopyrimidine deaminase/5-amino-6-(5-phosphoribosylamino)uracil reductase
VDEDWEHLRRALALAARGRPTTAPNPMVGAVLVRDGRVVGEGWHRRAGEPHAEPLALAAAGAAARGATLYVNLEPCSHHGRTPPCTDAVLAAGVARVVACHRDPDPRVAGAGFARLVAAGVAVTTGLLVEEAVRLNHRFLLAATRGRPAVTLKWAMSLDGKIATAGGDSRWISSPEARAYTQGLRDEHEAILVGSGTVLADDPLLTRRSGRRREPILRLVADRRLRTPPRARLFGGPGPVLVYAGPASDGGWGDRRRALEAAGATVVELPTGAPAEVLADLYRRGPRSLLVEGGGEVLAGFVEAGLYDRVEVLAAPLLIGGRDAPGPLAGAGEAVLARAPRLESLTVRRRGGDVVLSGFRAGCLRELCSSVAA